MTNKTLAFWCLGLTVFVVVLYWVEIAIFSLAPGVTATKQFSRAVQANNLYWKVDAGTDVTAVQLVEKVTA